MKSVYLKGTLGACLFAVAMPALASHEVYSPIVEQGEKELELTTDYVTDSSSDDNHEVTHYLEAGYGIGPRWGSELLVEFEKPRGEGTDAESVEWENVFQLSEQGEHFVDYGLFLELAKALEDESPDEVAGGLLLQKEFGSVVSIINLIAAKQVGDNAEDELEGEYSGQLRWRLDPRLEPTLEVYNKEEGTKVGTLLHGKFHLEKRSKLGYSIGMMWGADNDTPNTLRGSIEYEF